MNELEEFLTEKAKELHSGIMELKYLGGPTVAYNEHTNPDAIEGDAWIKSKTSYIWKVGTLSIIDPNKCDWVILLIGHKRSENHRCEFIGSLSWNDGENDDIGRCLRRYLDCADMLHPVFMDD